MIYVKASGPSNTLITHIQNSLNQCKRFYLGNVNTVDPILSQVRP